MSQSSRSDKEQKPLNAQDKYAVQSGELQSAVVLCHGLPENRVAITSFNSVEIVNLEPVKSPEEIYYPFLTIADAEACAVSSDQKCFAVLSRDKIRTWSLDEVKSIDDFTLETAKTCEFKNAFGVSADQMFFIGNSHVVTRHSSINTNMISIIDLNNGRIIATRLRDAIDLCSFGRNRIITAQGNDGLFFYDLQFEEKGDVNISPRVKLFSAPNHYFTECAIAANGKFLAGITLGFDRKKTIILWEIQQDFKLKEIGRFSCHNMKSPIFFTIDNFLVFGDRSERMCVFDPASDSLQTFRKMDAFCEMPNGSLLDVDEEDDFKVYEFSLPVFQEAFVAFLQAIEVTNATNMPRMLGGIVAGYAVEQQLFSKAKPKKRTEDENQHAILNSILIERMNHPRVRTIDKLAMSEFMRQKGSIRECVAVVMNIPGISLGLRGFMQDLNNMYTPKIKPQR